MDLEYLEFMMKNEKELVEMAQSEYDFLKSDDDIYCDGVALATLEKEIKYHKTLFVILRKVYKHMKEGGNNE